MLLGLGLVTVSDVPEASAAVPGKATAAPGHYQLLAANLKENPPLGPSPSAGLGIADPAAAPLAPPGWLPPSLGTVIQFYHLPLGAPVLTNECGIYEVSLADATSLDGLLLVSAQTSDTNLVRLVELSVYRGSLTNLATLTFLGCTNDTTVASLVVPVTNGIYTVFAGADPPDPIARIQLSAEIGRTPTILRQPADQDVLRGDNAAFSVLATGAVSHSYLWCHQTRPLPQATNATLLLERVQPPHAGSYHVVVRNFAGIVTSQPARLLVRVPLSGTTIWTNGFWQFLVQGDFGWPVELEGTDDLLDWRMLTNVPGNRPLRYLQTILSNQPTYFFRVPRPP